MIFIKRFWNWVTNETNGESGSNSGSDTAGERTLYLEGEIAHESWWADEVTPKMFKDELNAGSGNITVWINSPGGDVFCASEIYNMLKEYAGKVTVKINALAASAASVIAMSGDEVLISPVGYLFIHNPSTMAWGESEDMKKAQAMLNTIKEGIINAYQLKTHLSRTKISHMMDEEAFLNAQDAVGLGFADGIMYSDGGSGAEEAGKSGKKFEQLGGLLKAVGAGIGAVVVAAGAAAIKLGAEVVQQFGELEQNLGGSEAVFGEYASRIQKTGEDAYKNLGVSQSQYLATANKMGALFQGSGIEQQRSLELTEQAMQRAADMASVMGISVDSAMEAVTGAAKGNLSMMDNLGVGMNATSVEAYALSKGLDFAWASASNAEKAEVSMQMFFEKTEQYSGNFANEATQTISGSIGLLQAAVGSFTAGLRNADADMENLTQNLVDAFQAVVTNIVPVLENIVSSLPTAMDAILQAIADLLPMLLETVMNLFTQVLETILGLLPELIPAAVDAVMTIVDALIENLPLLVDAAVQLILALVEGIGSALPELVPAAIQTVITIVEGLLENLPLILDAAMQLLFGLADGLIAALPILIDALPHIIDTIISFLVNNLPRMIEMGVELVIKLALGLVQAIPNLLAALPQILGSIINGMMQWHSKIGEMGKNIIQSLWNGIVAMGQWLADNFSGMIAGIVNTVVNAINGVLGTNMSSSPRPVWKIFLPMTARLYSFIMVLPFFMNTPKAYLRERPRSSTLYRSLLSPVWTLAITLSGFQSPGVLQLGAKRKPHTALSRRRPWDLYPLRRTVYSFRC